MYKPIPIYKIRSFLIYGPGFCHKPLLWYRWWLSSRNLHPKLFTHAEKILTLMWRCNILSDFFQWLVLFIVSHTSVFSQSVGTLGHSGSVFLSACPSVTRKSTVQAAVWFSTTGSVCMKETETVKQMQVWEWLGNKWFYLSACHLSLSV